MKIATRVFFFFLYLTGSRPQYMIYLACGLGIEENIQFLTVSIYKNNNNSIESVLLYLFEYLLFSNEMLLRSLTKFKDSCFNIF